jgi:hypothetical protein
MIIRRRTHLLRFGGAALFGLVSLVPASAAAALGPNHVCDNWGLGRCLSAASSSPGFPPGAGDGLVVSGRRSALRWDEVPIGRVSNRQAWPFRPGSGLNSRYNGAVVYQLALNENRADCAGGGGYLVFCNSGPQRLWVRNGYWLINVAVSSGPQSVQLLSAWGSKAMALSPDCTNFGWGAQCGPAQQNWAFS